jgi:uncharacterized DUF497 family protein
MEELRFAWDARKARANLRRHRVSFEEAQTVFFDEEALVLDDPEHSQVEERFILLGMSAALRLLSVCHCVREAGSLIRIIGARRAVRAERQQYWERLRR